MLFENPVYRVMGDRALLVELGDCISPVISRRVREVFVLLQEQRLPGLIEVLPGYRSLTLVYDPRRISFAGLKGLLSRLVEALPEAQVPAPRNLTVPVVYGGRYGPDLDWVAAHHHLSAEEVVRLHAGTPYQVYMIGFSPGFAYLGELPAELDTPRRATPRTRVPQGSVAIAQRQTGIYPVSSPGGWQIIGWSPMRFFDPAERPPTPLSMGDRVQFLAVSEKELEHWELNSWKSSHRGP